ncbi:hypothetical protein KKC00_02260 [Patescibacteria group bacterium]|nr:hypothetical protein [Patescibacteria group bacterium]
MANNVANSAFTGGIIVSIAGAGVTGGISLLGIPALCVARVFRAALDKKAQKEERRREMNGSLVPFNPLGNYGLNEYYGRPDPFINQVALGRTLDPDLGLALFEKTAREMAQARLLDSAARILDTSSVTEMVRRHRSPPSQITVNVSSRRTIFGGHKSRIKIKIS